MDGWMQTAVEVTSATLGLVAIAVVLLLFIRTRRRRREITRQRLLIAEQEWLPIRGTTSTTTSSSPYLGQDLTRVVAAQTQVMNTNENHHHLTMSARFHRSKYSMLDSSVDSTTPSSGNKIKSPRTPFKTKSPQQQGILLTSINKTGSRDDDINTSKKLQHITSSPAIRIRAVPNDYQILRPGHSLPSLFNENNSLDQHQLLEHSDSETRIFSDLLTVDGSANELKACSNEELYDLSPDMLPEEWSGSCSHPTIEFSLTHVAKSNSLVVQVTRLVNVSLRNRASTSVVIKMKLTKQATPTTPKHDQRTSIVSSVSGGSGSSGSTLSRGVGYEALEGHPQSPTTSASSLKRAFDAENGTFFTFSGFSCSDLREYHLWMFLYHCKIKILREILLGEVTYSLAQLELSSRFPVRCIEKIQFPSKKRHTDALFKDLAPEDGGNGQLMLTLFYQTLANRMKVLVRKADRLPRKKKVLAQPGYYVIVNTMCAGKIVISQETKSVHGRSPVWNHPFIFDIPEKDLDKYSMQFIVMFGKSSHHQGVAGQVIIGPDVRDSGRAHWLEAFQPRSTESARWHKLQQM